MVLNVWFLLLIILSSSSGTNGEVNQSLEDDESNNNKIPEHLYICLKVVSKENFDRVKNSFKKVIADYATRYCRETLVIEIDDLKVENVIFDDIGTCSDSEKCVTGSLQIVVYVHPYSLNEIHLKDIWNKAKAAPLLKELGIEECKESTSNNVWIITLIIIIVILGIVLAVLFYLSWDRLLLLLSCSKGISESNKATTDDNSWTYRNNDIYDSAYIQPPGYTASYSNDPQYFEPIQIANNQYLTVLSDKAGKDLTVLSDKVGKDNGGYQPDSGFNSVQRSGNTQSANDNEESDGFDSGEEFSYPSPLKAPAIPPRNENSGDSKRSASISSQSTLNTSVGTSVHYLSSPIQRV